MTKFFIDGDLRNADWTKQTWDFPGQTPEQVARRFAGQDPEHVAKLPVMVHNPAEAAAVLDYMRQHMGGKT
jgi:hypothetical protein